MPEISDDYGKLHLPATRDADGVPAGDPGLGILGQYLKAYLNAKLQLAWGDGDGIIAGSGVGAGHPVVRRVFFHNPKERGFNDNDSPSLYLWRTGSIGMPEWMCEDARVTTEGIAVQWICPGGEPDVLAQREPFFQAVGKAIDDAVCTERDICFVLPDQDDDDPYKESYGSNVWDAIGAYGERPLTVKSYRPEGFTVAMSDGGRMGPYPSLMLTLEIKEQRVRQMDHEEPNDRTSGAMGIASTTPDDPTGAFDLIDFLLERP